MATKQLWATFCVAAITVMIGGCKPGSPGPTDPDNPQTQTFEVTLEWTAPTTDAGGEPLDDLAGYRLHYRTSSPADGPGSSTLEVTGSTRATVASLTAGRWYFGVTARDISGNESGLSNEISVEVGP